VSRVLAAGGQQRSLTSASFFGDFSLRGDVSLAAVAAFYPVGELPADSADQSINSYFAQKFHRRVVVGDQLRLGGVQVTVRELHEESGAIATVGVKLLAQQ